MNRADWPYRLKRFGWACADVAFHLVFTLALVILGALEAAWALGVEVWHWLFQVGRGLSDE